MATMAQLTEDDIRKALVRTGRVPEGDPDGVGETLIGLVTGRTAMRDVQGLTDEELESMYALGFAQFQAGRYEEAERIFAFVCMMEHREAKYWTALGAARFSLGGYEAAILAYASASAADPDDPVPPLRAADCLMKLGQGEQAVKALEAAIEVAGDSAEHAALKDKATALLDLIEAKV